MAGQSREARRGLLRQTEIGNVWPGQPEVAVSRMAGPQRAPVDAALGGYTPFFAVFFVVVAASVGFAAADLIYGARRAQDRT